MAITYNISLTNGLSLAGIPEKSTNKTASSITLYGRGVDEYGEGLQNNLIHILENFASSTAPPNPLTGQLWYDALNGSVKFFNGSAWVGVGTPGAGIITDAMISISAGIAIEKLEKAPSAGQLIISDIALVPRYQTISGDINILENGQANIIKDSKIQLSGALKGSAIMVDLGDIDITTELANLSVSSSSIINNAVTNLKLADDSVSTSKLQELSVTEDKMDTNAVSEDKLKNDAVTNSKLASAAVTSVKIALGTIKAINLDINSIGTDKIINNAVTASKIAANSILSTHIPDGSISATQLANGVIDNTKLANNSISASNLQANSIGSVALSSNAVKSIHLAASSVFASHINIDAITRVKIQDLAVDNSKIEDSSINVDKIDHGGTAAIDTFLKYTGTALEFATFAGSIPNGFITGDMIAPLTITDANLKPFVLTEDYGLLNPPNTFSNEVAGQDLADGNEIVFDYGNLTI